MANPPGSFIWYELMTSDAGAAARFYGDVVGWRIDRQPAINAQGRDYRMITRSDGGSAGGVLQLTPEMQVGGARPLWLGYLYTPDVDAASKAIEEDGGVIQMRMDLPVGQIAMVTDPMGTPFYIMNPVPPPGEPDAVSDVFDPVKPQHVNWNELITPNLARAKVFYEKHFGFRFDEAMPMGELGDYWFIDHGGIRPGAMMQQPRDSPLATWLFYFGVPSLTAAQRAITQGGGAVVIEAQEVPGGCWALAATDPQGAPFGVVGPRDE